MIIVGKFITPSIISSSSQDDQHSSPRHFQELQFQANLKKTSEEDDSSSKFKKTTPCRDQGHQSSHQEESQCQAKSKKTSEDDDPKTKKMNHFGDRSLQLRQTPSQQSQEKNIKSPNSSIISTNTPLLTGQEQSSQEPAKITKSKKQHFAKPSPKNQPCSKDWHRSQNLEVDIVTSCLPPKTWFSLLHIIKSFSKGKYFK